MEKRIIDLDLNSTALWAYEYSSEIVSLLPSTGDRGKNYKWMKNRKDEWYSFVDNHKENSSEILLLSIPLFIITDLLEVIKTKSTIDLITPLYESCYTIHNRIDYDGSNFDVYEKADFLINKLYNITGFIIWDL